MTAWLRRIFSATVPTGEDAAALMTLVAYALIGFIGLTYPYEQQREAQERTQTSQQPAPPPIAAEPHEAETGQQTKALENESVSWYADRDAPQWWLVIVGIITFLVVGWQAWETRKTAEAAERNVTHSREMLRATQDGQRAWVTLQVLRFDPPQRSQPFVIRLTIENCGGTPARIHDFRIAVWVQAQTQFWPDWTPAFNYGPSRRHEAPRLLTAHERTNIRTVLWPVDESFFADNNNTLCIAGYVEYQLTKDATRHRLYGFARQYDRGLSHDEGRSKFRYASNQSWDYDRYQSDEQA